MDAGVGLQGAALGGAEVADGCSPSGLLVIAECSQFVIPSTAKDLFNRPLVMSPYPSIAVVGAGMLGMTLAFRLAGRGCKVTLFESEAHPGGLTAPRRLGRYTWDRFYHVVLLSDTHLMRLVHELSLSDRVRWGETKTGFFTDGRLYSLSNSKEFVTFPPLNLIDKARLGWTIFYASKIKNWQRLESVTVADWLGRLSGKRTFSKIWLPLLKSKLGNNYTITSAAFIWATIRRMYAARRSGSKKEMFGYIDGGYKTLLERFVALLDHKGVTTFCSSTVRSVTNTENGVAVETTNGTTNTYDAAVLTVPCPLIADICPGLSPSERDVLNRVTYQGVICGALITKKPLAGYYVTNITADDMPFTGVIEMTALVSRDYFDGNALVYLPRYVSADDRAWLKKDDELENDFLGALKGMYPSFQREDVLSFTITRARHVHPIPTLHYSATLLPSSRTSLAHIYIVNSAQIPNGTMNVNEIVGLADRKAEEIAGWMTNGSTDARGHVKRPGFGNCVQC